MSSERTRLTRATVADPLDNDVVYDVLFDGQTRNNQLSVCSLIEDAGKTTASCGQVRFTSHFQALFIK